MTNQLFDITGMSCAACQANITRNVEKLPGIEKVQVNLISNKMTVDFDEEKINTEEIINTVISIGYGAALHTETTPTATKSSPIESSPKKENTKLRNLIISAILLVPLMYLAMGHMMGLPVPEIFTAEKNILISPFTQMLITLVVVFLNKHFFISGFKALIKKAPNMDTLVAVGSGAALIYGIFAMYMMMYAQGHGDTATLHHYAHNLYFESSAMILTLVSLGKYLESRSKRKTTDAISKLINLAPKTATIIRNGEKITIPADQLIIGDIIVIKPGDSIPADGIVTEGHGLLDQAAITGESIPVDKFTGDQVISATVNKNGTFNMKATRVGSETTLAQIVKLVEDAGNSKAPIARLADKISGIFVPCVIAISLITAIIWLIAGYGFEFALNCAISVLVISCPCALGLATPVAIMVGTGKAAEYGILVKSAESLEQLHSVNTLVFDKTGTLTTGKPSVTDVIVTDSTFTPEQLLSYAAAAESGSEHPLAYAITEKAKDLPRFKADNFIAVAGFGVEADIEGHHWAAGNVAFAIEKASKSPKLNEARTEASRLAKEGKTPLIFTQDGKIVGIIAVADTIRPEAPHAIRQLRAMGINTVMLTGDNHFTAEAMGKILGISHIISDVLPQDKEAHIRELQKEGNTIAMVGDGINDAPALTRADIGIAIGAGTDIAIDAADVVLIKDSVTDIVTAIKLSRSVIRNIRMNLFWAFFYNILGIPLAAGVLYPALGILLSPMIGSAAMSLSSVCVVTNALRLRYFKSDKEKGNDSMKKVLTVNGMSCNHCKASVERALSAVDGVAEAEVNLKKKTATVVLNKEVEDSVLLAAVTDAGFEPVSCK